MNAALILLALCSPGDLADPDEAVEAGRDALGEWTGYPWYDSASDSVRRIDVQPPAPPPPPTSNWSGFDLDWVGTTFQWTALILLLALLAVLIFMLVRSFLDRGIDETSASIGVDDDAEQEQARVEALPFPVKRGKLDLLEQAREHYRQGNFGQAVVYLFSFQLVQLDKHQMIRLTKGKTNRQYLREVGARETLRQLVTQTMTTFEDVFFGNHTIDRVRFESCWSRVDEFQRLVGQASG